MGASVITMVVVSIIIAAISRQLTDEFKAWTPWLTRKLIALAVRKLPECLRERFSEEWSSYVAEIPGEIGKFLATLGLLQAGIRIGCDFRRDSRLGASSDARDGKRSEKGDASPIRRLSILIAVNIAELFVTFAVGAGVAFLTRRLNVPVPYQIVGLFVVCAVSFIWFMKGEPLLLRRLMHGASRIGS